ncbi:hypothetical protein VTO42DRAFT_4849 [Malbranchea cinnamomea]
MTENEELLARISQLAGQINQRKNQAASGHRGGYHPASYSTRPHPGWAPYRGRGRPYRRPVTHRNRTLVLNNAAGTTSHPASATPTTDFSNDEANSDAKPSQQPQQTGWISKRDRHMQLINSAIYDQETQARVKAIEESRKLKAQRRTQREQAKVMRYVHTVGHATAGLGNNMAAPTSYQIIVQGIPFQVAQGGSKLIRISSGPFAANTTPKKAIVGGVTFVRSKRGNLYRLGAVRSKKKPRVTKKNELCKRFSSTGTCYKGPNCPYIHDPDKVAICKEFLQTGNCPAGQACDLSHEPSPERSPACVHFIRGRCTNPSCRYAHVRVTPGAPVCRAFAILGYCGKGARCEERHVHECPDYANTGHCGNKKCQLPHIDRAGQIRKLAADQTGTEEQPEDGNDDDNEDEDLSSEEEYDEIDSDDVDSDDLDEPEEIVKGTDNSDITQQQDFIRF